MAAILNSRFSAERVPVFGGKLVASERMNWPGRGQIHCGHNPFLFAQLVDNLAVDCDAGGKEKATWQERPKPDILRKLRMRDQ